MSSSMFDLNRNTDCAKLLLYAFLIILIPIHAVKSVSELKKPKMIHAPL
jgi:hypothetical protein